MIDREKVIKGLETCAGSDGTKILIDKTGGEVGMKKEYIVELREEEADELMDEHWVGELVRCKDCAFRDDLDGMCEHVQQVRDPDWYCADGERKSEDEILMEEMDADPLD